MSTKAFTSNINDQITVRGYLDENDQLIMLEPEGSGGGGVTTVPVTLVDNTNDPTFRIWACCLLSTGDYSPSMSAGENNVIYNAGDAAALIMLADTTKTYTVTGGEKVGNAIYMNETGGTIEVS